MRLEKLRQQMAEDNIDGFLITQPENRRYLSGFTGSSGLLIITQEEQLIATDSRYYEQVREQCPEWELYESGYNFTEQMLELLRRLGLGARRVGFEANHVNISLLHRWERALMGRLILVHTTDFVEELRMRKEDEEIETIRKAVTLADEAWTHVASWIQPGMSEKQVAWELEKYMRTHGAEAISFEPLVGSGPNGAKPHLAPTERLIQSGEPIVIDFGCVVDGYCSDITRTVSLSEPHDEKYITVWNTVLQAQQAALQKAKAGMTGAEIDALARDSITEAGYGEYFGHGLGHGVGLAIHEIPRFSYTYPHKIPVRSVVTVEPGIYIPGWGGVRIEDMVLVQEDGVEVLTQAPKHAVINFNQRQ